MLGNKTSLNKFKKTEIISSIFSDHSNMKLEINYKKKIGKFTNLVKENWVKEETKREIKKYFKTNENGNTTYQHLRDAAKVVLRGNFIGMNAYIKKQEIPQIT